jgi:hypothetical protein
MFDQEILASQIKADRFPFPHGGNITLAVRNQNYALGPVMLELAMAAGSVIPAHIHEGVAEVSTQSKAISSTRVNNTSPGRRSTSGEASNTAHTPPRRVVIAPVLWTANAVQANLADFVIPKAPRQAAKSGE